MLYEMRIFKNTAKITGEKTPALESLFNKVTFLQTASSFKKRLRHKCFPLSLNSWYSKKKNINVICKDLVNRVARKQEFDQRAFFTGFQIDKYHE